MTHQEPPAKNDIPCAEGLVPGARRNLDLNLVLEGRVTKIIEGCGIGKCNARKRKQGRIVELSSSLTPLLSPQSVPP